MKLGRLAACWAVLAGGLVCWRWACALVHGRAGGAGSAWLAAVISAPPVCAGAMLCRSSSRRRANHPPQAVHATPAAVAVLTVGEPPQGTPPPSAGHHAGHAEAAAEGIYRARYQVLKPGNIMPPIVPQLVQNAQKIATEFCAKKLPHVPPKGGLGNGFGGLDGEKIAGYYRAKRRPHGQRPANRRRSAATRKGR